MTPATPYPRDLLGYGRNPPDPRWPGGARIALQFVVNYEEGGENNILHGDGQSWTPVPHPLGAHTTFTGIASARAEIWAVGPTGLLKIKRRP